MELGFKVRCLKPITLHGQTYNCGNCINCRINKTSEWTVRLLFELDKWETASFVTLTYNDENLPSDFGLHPEELKAFHESLRYHLRDYDRKFKYYSVGEYGDKNFRPHYHCILFGLNPDPYDKNNIDRQLIADSWKKCDDFMWRWKPKHNAIDYVTREDINYVTGYVQKKLNGDLAIQEYGDLQRPFARSSTKLGLDYALKNADRISQTGYISLNGQKIGIPRYFREKLGIEQKEVLQAKSSPDKIKREVEFLYKIFVDDMDRLGIWNSISNNPSAMERRFKYWYESRSFELSKQVETNFKQRSHIKRNRGL